jgi:hypothetical protein
MNRKSLNSKNYKTQHYALCFLWGDTGKFMINVVVFGALLLKG